MGATCLQRNKQVEQQLRGKKKSTQGEIKH